MASKTFKLGEVCKGGVITVETTAKTVTVIGKEWDTSKGFNKGSDQSQAKEFERKQFQLGGRNTYLDIKFYLEDLTTCYWADEICEWVTTKVDLKKQHFFN